MAVDLRLILDTVVYGLEKYPPLEEYNGPVEPVVLLDAILHNNMP